ncbi:MAG TPA: hypothetical protein VHA37_03165, partial [Candidatus Saccharimonadales bacterium]|nr:hypothetical protein [Candidatus Saccharimonadales bacterium]
VQPDSTTVTAGTAINFTVTALDYTGAPAKNYTGTVHLTSSDGSATLAADAALVAGTGTFAVTLKTPGLQTVTVTDTASTSITGTSQAVTVIQATGQIRGGSETPQRRTRPVRR